MYDTDGALIEGIGMGGNVLIVSKEPEFIRDVCPYFAPSIVLVFAHIIYIYTGKLVMPVVLIIVACPLFDKFLKDDVQNLTPKSERAFFHDKRFLIPLYVFNIIETATWLWALVLFSDKINIDMYWFKLKPETTW